MQATNNNHTTSWPSNQELNTEESNSEQTINNRDLLEILDKKYDSQLHPPQVNSKEIYGTKYHLKQQGSNFLIFGGSVTAAILLFTPEPIITKLIGGGIAFACILGGGASKHILYKNAYKCKALIDSIQKLHVEIDRLDTHIDNLQSTSDSLQSNVAELSDIKITLQNQADNLKAEIERVKNEITTSLKQLNVERNNLMQDKLKHKKSVKLKLEQIKSKQSDLDSLSKELDQRRKYLASAEQKLIKIQARLLKK